MTAGSDRPPVVLLGEAFVALVAIEPGPLAGAGSFAPHVVGAESNVAIALARLGVPAAFVGRTGDDAFGQAVRRALRADGVDVEHLTVDPERPTGLLVRDRRAYGGGEVAYYRERSAGSRLDVADVEAAADRIRGAAWLHVSGVTPALGDGPAAAVERALELAASAGVPASLDVNHRARLWTADAARARLRPLVPRCALLLADEAEARLLVGDGAPADDAGLVGALRALGAATAVLKLGPRGALGLDAAGPASCAAPDLRAIVDAVGAGDALAAGVIAATLAGEPLAERLRWGCELAGLAMATRGDVEGLPGAAELRRHLAGGRDVVSLTSGHVGEGVGLAGRLRPHGEPVAHPALAAGRRSKRHTCTGASRVSATTHHGSAWRSTRSAMRSARQPSAVAADAGSPGSSEEAVESTTSVGVWRSTSRRPSSPSAPPPACRCTSSAGTAGSTAVGRCGGLTASRSPWSVPSSRQSVALRSTRAAASAPSTSATLCAVSATAAGS